MKYLFSILYLFYGFNCSSQSICITVDCKDTIRYPAPVTLNGLTTSSDGVKSRLWTVKSGSALINNSAVDTTFATMTADGLYVFQLTGTSNRGAFASAFDSVIYVANKPPQAVTGPTVNANTNTAVLSGSGSFDFEGLPITYNWAQLSGPNVAAINTVTMANPIVSGLINGTYVFGLTVKDQGGLTSSAQQTVIVAIPVTVIKTVTTVQTFYSDGTSTTVVTTVP